MAKRSYLLVWANECRGDSMRVYVFAFAPFAAMNTHASERVALVLGKASYADAPLVNP